MNFIKKIMLIIVMQFIAISAFAATKPGAKPTIWEIAEATPKKTNILDDVVDATNLNDVVEATGRKLDYDRTPLDNKVYKARVNPRIPATKAAIGSTAMKKLLKVSGWGYLATEALDQLLKGIDWVMDPEAQSIWRYKRDQQSGGDCAVYDSSGKRLIIGTGDVNPVNFEPAGCPNEAVRRHLEKLKKLYPDFDFVFEKWENLPPQLEVGMRLDFVVKTTSLKDSKIYHDFYSLKVDLHPDQTPQNREKETLTEDALADYMLGTHKDFQDEKYKKDLPKPNTWTSVAQVFKPENRFEEENSPTVKITQDQLDQALPESEDTTVKPTEPDPETGEKGWKFPPFCSWASAVCEHFKWIQKDDDLDQDYEEPDTSGLDHKFDTQINVSGKCPANPIWEWELMGVKHSTELPFNWFCTFFGYLSYGLMTFSAIMSCWMIYHTVTAKSGSV